MYSYSEQERKHKLLQACNFQAFQVNVSIDVNDDVSVNVEKQQHRRQRRHQGRDQRQR